MKKMAPSTVNGRGSTTKTRAELIATRLAGASCSRCVYLHAAADAGYLGECRRSAPAAGLVQLASQQGGVSVAVRPNWPLVSGDSWCGEYLARPRPK